MEEQEKKILRNEFHLNNDMFGFSSYLVVHKMLCQYSLLLLDNLIIKIILKRGWREIILGKPLALYTTDQNSVLCTMCGAPEPLQVCVCPHHQPLPQTKKKNSN